MQKVNPPGALLFRSLFCLFFVLIHSSKRSAQAQSLPPAKFDGFVYNSHPIDSNTISVEAFFDPVCPDSRDSWPPLKEAVEHYGPRVSLVLHLFPLSYHDNAFAASRALHIVNLLNSSSTFQLLEWFFKYQERFYNAPTYNMSRASVVKEIIEFAAAGVGNSYLSAIESGFTDHKTDLLTRVSFKYSASRGVSGTPTFFVNGFILPDAGSPLDYNEWRKVVDPLVSANATEDEDLLHFFL